MNMPTPLTFGNSIKQGLDDLLKENPSIMVLGEDICDPYGGAFKITKGLSTKYPGRILNTPMSEYALTGVASGLAIRGICPVLEIMFGDFLTICADQLINHAAKFKWMFNDQVRVPMVIRTPMGGRRGYGPTHSQTLEKLFLGIPDLKVIAPSLCHDPGTLLKKSVQQNTPVLFIENKLMYGQNLIRPNKDNTWEGYNIQSFGDDFPETVFSMTQFKDDQITIVTYGGMLPITLSAAKQMMIEEEIGSQIVVISDLNGTTMQAIHESLRTTGRALIVEEGTLSFGWGAEIGIRLSDKFFSMLKAPVRRVAAKDSPIGCTKSLEDDVLPQKEDIIFAVKEILNYGT